MPFPITDRVHFNKNPLDKVICQLRFPTLLRIEEESPVDFQEKIRDLFPEFKEEIEFSIQFPEEDIIKNIPSKELLTSLTRIVTNKKYVFQSKDKNWEISLTNNFIALTTDAYTKWEEFKSNLCPALTALNEIYKIAYYSRIGLRYLDAINRSSLGLDSTRWSELLNPLIAGIYSSDSIEENEINGTESQTDIKLDQGTLRLRSGLAKSVATNEFAFLIDSDFFTLEKLELDDAISRLDYFNKQSRYLFRWCITEKLYKAMEPQQI